MKTVFTPPPHAGCRFPQAIKCEMDVKEWIALEPKSTVTPFFLNIEEGFCDNYPAGTKQCISVTMNLIRKHNRYKHTAVYITLPNGDECGNWQEHDTTTW